jgi:hypothetical protein
VTTYEISAGPDGVVIELANTGDQDERLLAAFAACQQGKCACPTDEYQKVEGMDLEKGEGEILIRLRPKQGSTFDVGQLTACLEHTVGQAPDAEAADDRR